MVLDPSDDALAAIADYDKETTMSEPVTDRLTTSCPECGSGAVTIKASIDETPPNSRGPSELYLVRAEWSDLCHRNCRLPDATVWAVNNNLLAALNEKAMMDFVDRRRDERANPRTGGR